MAALSSASTLLPEFSTRRLFHFPCPKRADFPCIPSDGRALVGTAAGSSGVHANANKATHVIGTLTKKVRNQMKTQTFIVGGLAVHARTTTTARQLIIRRAWLWTGFLAFATIAFGPQPAPAAVTEAWVQRYSIVPITTTDLAVKVVRDAAGGIILTGSVAGGSPGADMLTIK